jgi:hypothetical protein
LDDESPPVFFPGTPALMESLTGGLPEDLLGEAGVLETCTLDFLWAAAEVVFTGGAAILATTTFFATDLTCLAGAFPLIFLMSWTETGALTDLLAEPEAGFVGGLEVLATMTGLVGLAGDFVGEVFCGGVLPLNALFLASPLRAVAVLAGVGLGATLATEDGCLADPELTFNFETGFFFDFEGAGLAEAALGATALARAFWGAFLGADGMDAWPFEDESLKEGAFWADPPTIFPCAEPEALRVAVCGLWEGIS